MQRRYGEAMDEMRDEHMREKLQLEGQAARFQGQMDAAMGELQQQMMAGMQASMAKLAEYKRRNEELEQRLLERGGGAAEGEEEEEEGEDDEAAAEGGAPVDSVK